MRKIISASVLGLLTACAVSKVDPLSIPLAYKASSKPVLAQTTSACTTLSRVEVEDRRTDQQLGVRFHESKPLKADVTLASDPTLWVQEGMQNFLGRNGVTVGSNGATLTVELHVLKTDENIWHRSGYDSKLTLLARVRSPSGKTCMEQSLQGKAGNYGYSGSVENYQEMLNNSLDAATQQLLDSPQFGTALCQCGT